MDGALNYRDLLKTYMRLILSEEGMTYVDWDEPVMSVDASPVLTPQEELELKKLSNEVRKGCRK